jgi:putative DNA primase/helicase
MNIVFLSNEVRPLKLDNTDRRYCVIWTPPQRELSFYQDVAAWFRNGGDRALHRYLLDYDTSGFDEHSKPPMTRAKVKLIDLSRSSSETFLLDWADSETPYPYVSGTKQQVYDGYKRWCLRTGQRFTQDIKVFARQVERLAESNSMPVREWRGDVGSGAAVKTMRCWQVGTRPERFANDREWMAWCIDDWATALRQSGSSIGGSDDAPM